MARNQSQISATISESTKEKLDRFTRLRGLKKNFVVEHALLFFMEAREELPEEAFIPSRLVLAESSFDELVEHLDAPAAPTDELKALLSESGD